ncbi:MAG: helix-turn-helix domain-containing protein [Arenicellales bacterium]|nr:helix-turn-helix domain-containing protein [Arenicellales bacterium]
MEGIIWLSVPAVIALLVKLLLLFYTQRSINQLTKLYLVFLFFLGLMNVGEIGHFIALSQDRVPFYSMHIYYLGGIMAMSTLLLLALDISYVKVPNIGKVAGEFVFALGVLLSVLLFISPWVITGYERLGLSATRVPGPLYPAVEILVVGVLLGSIALFVRGVVKHESPRMQLMNAYMIVAFIPLVLVGVIVLIALRFFDASVNAAVIGPIAITIFLLVTAYATHHYKLFDISFCIPSAVKKRTGGTEAKLQWLLSNLPETIPRVLKEIADAVKSPIALLGRGDPVVVGGTIALVDLDRDDLAELNEFTSTSEISDSRLRNKLKRNDIGFIAPFSPEKDSKSWLVFGSPAKETIVTGESFELTERLCDRINAYYGADFVAYKTTLQEVQEVIKDLSKPLVDTTSCETRIAVVSKDGERLRQLSSLFPHADIFGKRNDHINAHIIYADLGAFTSHDIRVWRKYNGAVVWVGEGDLKRNLFESARVYANKFYTWVDDEWLRDKDEVLSLHKELKKISEILTSKGQQDRVDYFNLSLDDQYLSALKQIDRAIEEKNSLVVNTTANRQEIIDVVKQRAKKYSDVSLKIVRSESGLGNVENALSSLKANTTLALLSFVPVRADLKDLMREKSASILEIRCTGDGTDVFLPGFKYRQADKIMYGRWVEGRMCMVMRRNPLPNDVLKTIASKANTAEMIRDSIVRHHENETRILPNGAANLTEAVDNYELAIIKKALKETKNNKSLAARKLGIRSNTLHYKLEHHGLERRKSD